MDSAAYSRIGSYAPELTVLQTNAHGLGHTVVGFCWGLVLYKKLLTPNFVMLRNPNQNACFAFLMPDNISVLVFTIKVFAQQYY